MGSPGQHSKVAKDNNKTARKLEEKRRRSGQKEFNDMGY